MEETSEEARFYTEEELQAMKSAGMEKPKNITWSQWVGPKKLNSRHHIVCYMSAIGLPASKIAEQTGLSKSRISALLTNPKIRLEIQHIQREMFSQDPRNQFNRMVPDAIRTIEQVMNNESEKGATRLEAAKITVERVMGKPTQTVDLGGNLIRSLFEKMDQANKQSNVIDVESAPHPEPKLLPESVSDDNVGESEETKLKTEEKHAEADAWIEENLGD